MDATETRKLAASTYNEAFEAVESAASPADALWALELAATSLSLWRRIGTEQNLAIGLWLYSRALVKAGAADLAVIAAKASLAHTENIDAPADWLVASGLEGYARALIAAKHQDAAQALEAARAAVDAIATAADRELIAGQLADLL
jgi:hypothetical protein